MNNKVAMITGASVGIGRAVALQMARKGAKLVLLDINKETLLSVEKEVSSLGIEVISFACDIANQEEVNEVAKRAFEKFGKIDVLINNAGLWRNKEPFMETSIDKWKAYIDVNVLGTVYCTKAVLQSMIDNGYGRIVNVASVAGIYGNANMTMYSATKGAVIAMTKALAKEVASSGVIVNSVSPGTVSSSENLDVTFSKESLLSYAGRTGTCEENADLICFLASEKNGYIIGQNIQIDGCRKRV